VRVAARLAQALLEHDIVTWPSLKAVIAIAVAYFLAFDASERGQITTALLGAARIQAPVVPSQTTRIEPLT
jgi:hypothetical protein